MHYRHGVCDERVCSVAVTGQLTAANYDREIRYSVYLTYNVHLSHPASAQVNVFSVLLRVSALLCRLQGAHVPNLKLAGV